MKKIYTLFLLFSLISYSLSAQLIINEVLFDPPNDIAGDANGDGTRSASEDEFIEFINNSSTALDISGYKIYDTTNYNLLPGTDTPRHTVPASTIIPENGTYVLFGGGTPTGIPGDIVETSTTGNLNLTNAGDIITVTNASGTVILSFDSSSTGLDFGANQSITRSPDITGDFVLHTTANMALLFSPGTTTDPTPPLTLNANTTGSFIFNPQVPINRPPVEVFYHIPLGDITTMPVVMAFHGADRNGSAHRDYWINMANANGFMVIAPEYSSVNYPGLGDNYLMANIFDDGDNPTTTSFNSSNEWTFSTLDPIFEAIKEAISGTQQKYNAWGHSGGAQFLHRFVTYLPNSKLDVAVCSNAGWYTVPEISVSFPYGIDNGQLPTDDLTTAFSKKLIVHLGQNDNDPNSAGLRHNAVVDAQQGIYRLERGQYYFDTSLDTADDMSVIFNWEKHEVSGVGHNPQLMANDALQYVFNSNSSILVINEVLYDPAGDLTGDSNGDGTRDPFDDEFIEFINNSATPLDITGYTVSDNEGVRHIFPSETIVPANGFLVLFGGGTPTGSFGGAIVQTASEGAGTLNLSNSGEIITVKNAGGTTVQTYDYSSFSSDINQSITRNPDITGNFVEHSTVVGGLLFSPGTLPDGTTLSIDELIRKELLIYPNPTSIGFVNMKTNYKDEIKVQVFNVLGKKVLNKFVSNEQLDISALKPGIYIIKIEFKDHSIITRKIVVK